MIRLSNQLIVATCALGLLLNCQSVSEPYVLMVSFDGFRYDYISRVNTPNFDHIVEHGASADGLIPCFPSKTFPNHYSLVTGMYPGNHGLVDNSFYHKQRREHYKMKDPTKVRDQAFYGGTPLWQLVQQNGMKSASYYWVGSEAPIQGSYPDYYTMYNHNTPNEDRIDQVFEWFELPEEDRPKLVNLYFALVDDAGHDFGPEASEVNQATVEADRLIGLILDKIKSSQLDINLVVVSDHGMARVQDVAKNYFYLSDISGLNRFNVVNSSTMAHVYTSTKHETDSLFNTLDRLDLSGCTIVKKSESPKEWHYRDAVQAGDILILMDEGRMMKEKRTGNESYSTRSLGTHGYDPASSRDMMGVFYAYGPQIKSAKRLSAFENIHVYPFVCQLLGIRAPEEIDGDPAVLQDLQKN
ncbi:MAG: alkaline phosphatase family protein [Cyclobacteriaceae bacterium]